MKEGIEERFGKLASKWRDETFFHSNSHFIDYHPAYQEIISMGKDVLPLIFKELEQNGGHWYFALSELTGAHPVSFENRGRVSLMKESWLKWGKEHGYI